MARERFRRFDIDAGAWGAAVLGPDGHIYCHRNNGTTVYQVEIDPVTETSVEYSASSAPQAWTTSIDGVSVGSVIWRVRPNFSGTTFATRFDTSSKTWLSTVTIAPGLRDWVYMALVGGLIMAWGGGTDYSFVDPSALTYTQVTGVTSRAGRRQGIVVGSEVYVPCTVGFCQVFGLGTWREFAIPAHSYVQPVRHPNGSIYVPYIDGGDNGFLVINPASDTYTDISYPSRGLQGGARGAVAPNGIIYWVSTDDVASYDPATGMSDAWTNALVGGGTGTAGVILASNAKLYAPSVDTSAPGSCYVIDWRKLAARGIGLGRGPRMIGTT